MRLIGITVDTSNSTDNFDRQIEIGSCDLTFGDLIRFEISGSVNRESRLLVVTDDVPRLQENS